VVFLGRLPGDTANDLGHKFGVRDFGQGLPDFLDQVGRLVPVTFLGLFGIAKQPRGDDGHFRHHGRVVGRHALHTGAGLRLVARQSKIVERRGRVLGGPGQPDPGLGRRRVDQPDVPAVLGAVLAGQFGDRVLHPGFGPVNPSLLKREVNGDAEDGPDDQ
jgi:hypothetical protein